MMDSIYIYICVCDWVLSMSTWNYHSIVNWLCMHAKLLRSYPTLCDPMDCGPPDPSVHGILQVKTLEWIAMPSSKGSYRSMDWSHVFWGSCIADRFFTAKPLGDGGLGSEFSRLDWSGLPFPSPGHLPNPGIEPGSLALQEILYCLSHQGNPIS